MNQGDTFLMPVPPSYDCPHLWIVISDPEQHGGVFIVVNATTNEFRAGRECVLSPEDHEWIKGECFISFGDALEIRPEAERKITALIGKSIHLQKPLTEAVLLRIIETAKQSKAMPGGFKRYLAAPPTQI